MTPYQKRKADIAGRLETMVIMSMAYWQTQAAWLLTQLKERDRQVGVAVKHISQKLPRHTCDCGFCHASEADRKEALKEIG